MTRRPDGQWMASLELGHGYHEHVPLVNGNRVQAPPEQLLDSGILQLVSGSLPW